MLTLDAAVALLDAVGCGVLLLDGSGRVLRTNERARRSLGVGDDPLAPNGTVQAALRAALRAAAELAPQLVGDCLVVPRPEARPLILRRVVLPGGGEGATTALVVLDLQDCPLPDEGLLRQVFLLTPAELRLARRLACGEDLATIAKGLGLRLGTLRVQLKALFLKTGTRRQGELVSLLAHLSRLDTR